VTDVTYPVTKGGSERRMWEISKRLALEHEIHIYCTDWENRTHTDIEVEGVHFHFINKARKIYSAQGKRTLKNSLQFATLALLRLLFKKSDITHCNQSPLLHCISGKIASWGRNPLVITWHEVWGDYWHEYLGKTGYFGKILERTVVRIPNKVIAVSNLTKQKLVSIGVKEENISLIQNGVDVATIQKSTESKRDYDVVFVGRLIRSKNVDFLIKAISKVQKHLPKINCLIIGDGPERFRLEHLVQKLRIQENIEFTGELETDELYSMMKSAKIFVSCSTMEGFGVAFLEANACGLPTIGVLSPSSAVNEIVLDGENGVLTDLSVEKISEEILFLLRNEDVRRRMSERGKKIIKKYSWDNVAKKTVNVYKEILDQKD
jgi:glycosyltransferase involved in cell wall biosynthesis